MFWTLTRILRTSEVRSAPVVSNLTSAGFEWQLMERRLSVPVFDSTFTRKQGFQTFGLSSSFSHLKKRQQTVISLEQPFHAFFTQQTHKIFSHNNHYFNPPSLPPLPPLPPFPKSKFHFTYLEAFSFCLSHERQLLGGVLSFYYYPYCGSREDEIHIYIQKRLPQGLDRDWVEFLFIYW